MNLDKIKAELEEIEKFLAEPDAYSKPEFAAKSKRATVLREILDLNKKIAQLNNNLEEAESLLNDPELGEMAKDDAENIKKLLNESNEMLEELLVPHNPEDDKAAIIEIRAGAGGDEASLFAGELYRMYV